jgi:hypothetical protein
MHAAAMPNFQARCEIKLGTASNLFGVMEKHISIFVLDQRLPPAGSGNHAGKQGDLRDMQAGGVIRVMLARPHRDLAHGNPVEEEHVFTCAMATARFLAAQKPGGTAFVAQTSSPIPSPTFAKWTSPRSCSSRYRERSMRLWRRK